MSDHNWMRQSIVDILQYLPAFLAHSQQFQAANDADSKEHDTILIDLQNVLDQFYVKSATWGLERWEELCGITTDKTLSDSVRRSTIIAKIQNPGSVTEAFLRGLINQYILDKIGTVTDHPETYSTDFNIPLVDKASLLCIAKDVRTYIPAHIGQVYKTHADTNIENHIAMLKSTVKTIDVYPAAVEKIAPESTFYTAMAMTTTERLTLYIGGI